MEVCYSVIGTIHTDLRDRESIPIQGVYSDVEGTVEILPVFREGLKDLEGFSHLFLIYHFHEAGPPRLRVRPFLDTVERGIFSTRHPDRPNAIGLSIVELISLEDSTMRVKGVDILDGTPLLDIKPYVGQFDVREPVRCGWLDEASRRATGTEEYTPAGLHPAAKKRRNG